MTNNEFGDFEMISDIYLKGITKYAKFKCKICGREKDAPYYRMKDEYNGASSHSKACLRQDEIERRKNTTENNDFGDFILLEDLGQRSDKNKHKIGRFKCKVCGREKVVNIDNATKGIGMSHKYCINNVEFSQHFKSIFNNMKTRCNNENCDRYDNYGGRGIRCEYEHLIDFYDDFYDMYIKHIEIHGKSNTTIDRIDVDGNYTKNNIRFMTLQEQARNKTNNRKMKVLDLDDGSEYYFNSISYGAEYLEIERSKIDNTINKINIFPIYGRYICSYYDEDAIKQYIQFLDSPEKKLKPLIEFID